MGVHTVMITSAKKIEVENMELKQKLKIVMQQRDYYYNFVQAATVENNKLRKIVSHFLYRDNLHFENGGGI